MPMKRSMKYSSVDSALNCLIFSSSSPSGKRYLLEWVGRANERLPPTPTDHSAWSLGYQPPSMVPAMKSQPPRGTVRSFMRSNAIRSIWDASHPMMPLGDSMRSVRKSRADLVRTMARTGLSRGPPMISNWPGSSFLFQRRRSPMFLK